MESSLKSLENESLQKQQELIDQRQLISLNQAELQKNVETLNANLSTEREQHAAVKRQYLEAMTQVARLERASTMDIGALEDLESSKTDLESQVSLSKTGLGLYFDTCRIGVTR
jgi:multidrug resistance efflux pump